MHKLSDNFASCFFISFHLMDKGASINTVIFILSVTTLLLIIVHYYEFIYMKEMVSEDPQQLKSLYIIQLWTAIAVFVSFEALIWWELFKPGFQEIVKGMYTALYIILLLASSFHVQQLLVQYTRVVH